MKQITFNYALGEELMERLLDAYERQYGIHGYRPETHAPQHLFIPEGMKRGSLEWRRWLARAAGTDRWTVSMRHYQSHVELQKTHPQLYTREAAMYQAFFVEPLLREAGITMPNQTARGWPILAYTLDCEFGDDPLAIYRGGSIESILAFKRQFKRERGYEPLPGYGPKISSLLAVFLEEAGLVKIEDALPVDLHAQRIFISTGIITLHEVVLNEVLENEIRLFVCDLCTRKGWSRVKLAHALWFLGNKGCTVCHRHSDMELACVLWSKCGGRASSVDYFGKGQWNPNLQSHRKGGSRVFRLEPVPAESPQRPLFVQDQEAE